MLNNKLEQMQNVIRTFAKGVGTSLVTEKIASDKEMNKGRGENKNPYLDGRLVIRTIYSGVVMGTDYSQSLANAHKRITGETMDKADVNLKSSWHVPFPSTKDFDYAVWFDKKKSEEDGAETTAYLKIQRTQKQAGFYAVKTQYFLFGELVEDDETLADIEQWKKKKNHTQSSTQIECGMDKDSEQYYQCIDINNVRLIKQGEKVLTF